MISNKVTFTQKMNCHSVALAPTAEPVEGEQAFASASQRLLLFDIAPGHELQDELAAPLLCRIYWRHKTPHIFQPVEGHQLIVPQVLPFIGDLLASPRVHVSNAAHPFLGTPKGSGNR